MSIQLEGVMKDEMHSATDARGITYLYKNAEFL
jgi:hypothetical protein